QGEAGTETSYGSPLDAALQWQTDGAEWVHLVDLDAAFGRGSNRDLLAEVVGALDVKVEMSGGIRDDDSLEAALATGCARVNLGTAALEDPDWCAAAIARHGDRIAVGLDVRVIDGEPRLRGRGWVSAGSDAPVVAAGGVASIADLEAIATLVPEGVEGSIVGKALYAGRFTLPEALAAVSAR